MSLYKYYVYSDFELCFQGQMKVCEVWAYLCRFFYVLHPNANEMFQKELKLFPTAVKVGRGRVGYCLSHSKFNRFRVGAGD